MPRDAFPEKPLLVNGGETGRWQIFRPPRTMMEFFPANRACRKSASCSSITVCCRRKIGACPGTREPKRKKRFAMETWNLDGAEGVAVFCSSIFYCSHFSNVFWLSTGGGPRQLFCKKFTLLRNAGIGDQNSEF
jgi:hypothetical protein